MTAALRPSTTLMATPPPMAADGGHGGLIPPSRWSRPPRKSALRTLAARTRRFLEALYDLAEHEELAKRVRESRHRSRQSEAGRRGSEADDTSGTATAAAATPGESAPGEVVANDEAGGGA